MQLIAMLVRKSDGLRMQEQPFQSVFRDTCVDIGIAVARIARDRMFDALQVHADLMGTAT